MSITNGGNIVPRDDNNDIVPIEDGPAIISGPTEIQRYDPLANHQVFLTCLNMDEERDRIAYASARSKADMDAGQMIGKEFTIRAYVIHPAITYDQKTGEEIRFDRTVIITGDDKTIAFGAVSILKAISGLCVVTRSRGPWNPPLRVRLEQIPTRTGGRIFELRYLGVDRDAREKGGKSRG